MNNKKQRKYVVAITGASGSIYGVRLLGELLERGYKVSLLVSEPGKLVLNHELGLSFESLNKPGKLDKATGEAVAEMFYKYIFRTGEPQVESKHESLVYYDDEDLMAPVCSGSHLTEGMIIIPCSMATVGSVANGISSTLIERTADVMLKESRRLVLMPRETPLNRIHLKNMLALQEAGAQIVPAMPAFYHNPQTIGDLVDFVVGRVLDSLRIEHNLFKRWDEEQR